jgi:hypothetical protein
VVQAEQVTPPPPPKRDDRRRNALIAAAVAVPVAVVLAFAFAPGQHSKSSGGVLAPISVTAPAPDDATLSQCAQVMSALPVQIVAGTTTLAPRVVHPNPPTAQVVAWGDPAVVLVCGVGRPSDLVPNSSTQVFALNGVNWFQTKVDKSDVFVSIDRAVYVQVTVPEASTAQPLALLAQDIAKVLPAVCQVPAAGQPAPATDTLCTHRK